MKMKVSYFSKLFVWSLLLGSGQVAFSQNPVAEFYRYDGYPAWTDSIKWSNRINMATYNLPSPTATLFEKFEHARDVLYAQGGGVLYYPAGVYDFADSLTGGFPIDSVHSRGLMLKSGVVILGEKPTSDSLATKNEDGSMNLGTKFKFPFRTLNLVDYNQPTHKIKIQEDIRDGIGGAKDTSIIIKSEFTVTDVLIKELSRDTILRNPLYTFNNNISTLKDSIFQWQSIGTGQVPKRWNIVGVMPGSPTEQLKDIKNVGVCWIDFEGATVYIGPQLEWKDRYDTIGFSVIKRRAWESRLAKVGHPWGARKADGTHFLDVFCGAKGDNSGFNAKYLGTPSNIIIFGCQFNNATLFVDQLDYTKKNWKASLGPTGDFIYPNFFHTYRFAGRLTVYGSNVFVANNSITKPNKNFVYSQLVFEKDKSLLSYKNITFDYAKTLGIDINKQLIGQVDGLQRRTFSISPYYLSNVVVQDNYVYNHGHKGYEIAGEWVVIRRNRNKRDFLNSNNSIYGLPSATLTLEGSLVPLGPDDNLSRAFDLGGKSLWIDSNRFNTTGSYPGNDGEGILCQQHGDVDVLDWSITRNRYDKLGGNDSYMGGYDCNIIGMLIYKNHIPSGNVGNKKTIKPGENIVIVNNISKGVDGIKPDDYINGGIYPPKIISSCPTIKPTHPINVQIIPEPALGRTKITWQDTSSFEIAFRVERRSLIGDTTWKVIAYRSTKYRDSVGEPLLSDLLGRFPEFTSTSVIPTTVWYDYNTTGQEAVEYRVVAIGCSEYIKADFAYFQPNLCVSDSLVFVDTTQYDWNDYFRQADWDFNNDGIVDFVQTAKNQTVAYKFPSSGTYQVKMKITSNNYDYDSIVKTITIGSGSVIDFTVGTSPKANQRVAFKAVGVPSGANLKWDFDGDDTDDLTTNKDTTSFIYATQNTYNVKLSVTLGSCSQSITKVVTILPANLAPTDITISNASIQENNLLNALIGTLSAADPNTGDTFTFSLVNGLGSNDNSYFHIIGNQLRASISFDFETKSSYSIRVRVTDNDGLSYEKILIINVYDVNEIILGTNDDFVNRLTIYPNPVTNTLFVSTLGQGLGTIDVAIVNLLGQVILSRSYSTATESILELDLSGLASGQYFLKISTPAGFKVAKIIKE